MITTQDAISVEREKADISNLKELKECSTHESLKKKKKTCLL